MQDEDFEWDDRKAAANYARHQVTFRTARRAFEDEFAVVREDFRENYGEGRYSILGMVDGRILYVSYTFREDRIRIISARGAERYEKRLYHEANA